MLAGVRVAVVLLLGIPFTLMAEPIHISGRVQAGRDQKRVEARIELLPQTGETPVATAKSDAAGFFELTVPESGCFRARLQARGSVSLENPLLPVTEETGLMVPLVSAAEAKIPDLRLNGGWIIAAPKPAAPPPATPRLVQGKVSDPQGKPVPGALVWSEGSPDVPFVKTGADGTFQIHLPASGEAKLRATARGYLVSAPQSPAPGSQASLLLKLKEAGAITGRVVDAEGRPLARAQIVAFSAQWMGETPEPESAVAWSGTDGRFRLSSLSPGGLFDLMTVQDGFASASAKAEALSRDRPPAAVRIVLERGVAVRGRVVDREGKPVQGAELILSSANEGTLSRQSTNVIEGASDAATSDSKGYFAFRHLSPGRFRLRVRSKGFAPFSLPEIEAQRSAPVDLGTLTLDRGLAIAGRVMDPRGAPMPGAIVDLRPSVLIFSEVEGSNTMQQQQTDSEGRFSFDDLQRGALCDVRITYPGYLPASVESVEAPTPEPLAITLKTGRSLSGRVTDSAGRPVPKAQIYLREKRILRSSFGESQMPSHRLLGGTEGDGRFQVGGVAPGTADLEVYAPGYRAKSLQGAPVPEDGDVEGLEISLEPGCVLEARTLDRRGVPVAGAEVEARRAEPRDWGAAYFSRCRTDAEGRCRMNDLEPDRYTVSARSEDHGHAQTTLDLKPGVSTCDLVFRPGVEVSGRVSDETGEPVLGASLSLLPATTGAIPTAVSSTDGSFRFTAVGDGTFRLTGSAPGFAEGYAPEEIQVAGQEVRGLELRLSRGATLTGKVLGLDPAEAGNVVVFAFRADPTSPQPVGGLADREGRYRITDMGPGEWSVTAQVNGRSVQESLHLAPGVREVVLDLRFPSGQDSNPPR